MINNLVFFFWNVPPEGKGIYAVLPSTPINHFRTMIASFGGRKVVNEPSQLEFHASGKLEATCTRLCTLISDENIVISDYATL